MDPVAARLECLKLAASTPATNGDAEKIKTTAEVWSDFVIGPKVKEHAGSDKKGADDHLAHKK